MGYWKSKNGRSSPAPFASKSARPSTLSTVQRDEAPMKVLQQTAPLLALPLELIQNIASYLDIFSTASFCLSSRYTCYAIGRNDLNKHVSPSCYLPKFERRKNIEILERAFPSHWYCAWCDTFHRHDIDGGPTKYGMEMKRDCAEFNSYLHDGWEYVVCYHHVRLALNRELWGEEYGIGVDAFAYNETAARKLGKTALDTRLKCEARIVEGRLILHASYRVDIPPQRSLRPRGLATSLVPVLPQVVVGHRDSHGPHTGIRKCLENVLLDGGKSSVQLCSVCATDFSISCHSDFDSSSRSAVTPSPSQSVLSIKVWRDLGNGRNPFDASWRAHGELGKGREGFASDALRLASFQPGDIKKAFESGNPGFATAGPPPGMERPDGKSLEDSMSESWTQEIIRSRARREPTHEEGVENVQNASIEVNLNEPYLRLYEEDARLVFESNGAEWRV